MLQIIQRAGLYKNNIAIEVGSQQYTYADLMTASSKLAFHILNGTSDLKEQRVAYMVHPGFDYVTTLWAIWQAGGVAVPMCLTHPLPSLQHVVEDAQVTIVVISKDFENVIGAYLQSKGITCIILEELGELAAESQLPPKVEIKTLPVVDAKRMALILYTSGTTNKPKGVVTTHNNIQAQISTLVDAWEWSEKDHVLCVLPLHHVHGVINVIGCALWSGANCQFLPHFSAQSIFEIFNEGRLNVFMAVPTIYFKLISYYESLNAATQSQLTQTMRKFRLMVCGSAALPVSVMEKWEVISGHTLLERYGMTELGMAISNPYKGDRKAGYVGVPLPGVEVQLMDENYIPVTNQEPGEIVVKGNNVFQQYWNSPDATAGAFTQSGWFKTGDIAVIENGYYRILGRNSVDIIKSGGYKISALEIEESLRTMDIIEDCAVVGIESEEWGELIVAAIVLNKQVADVLDEQKLNDALVQKIAAYKKPRKYLLLDELPRNAMGKVVKNDVKKLFV